ncbi:hypothetical protein PG993_013146 [Apiospora rasikravindrae]|uniref:Uncharacterized protein n=1 Tax=Apiospora rasikravindrae TaxID=990691 RepID=A0ABR1RWT3_9PEZI
MCTTLHPLIKASIVSRDGSRKANTGPPFSVSPHPAGRRAAGWRIQERKWVKARFVYIYTTATYHTCYNASASGTHLSLCKADRQDGLASRLRLCDQSASRFVRSSAWRVGILGTEDPVCCFLQM